MEEGSLLAAAVGRGLPLCPSALHLLSPCAAKAKAGSPGLAESKEGQGAAHRAHTARATEAGWGRAMPGGLQSCGGLPFLLPTMGMLQGCCTQGNLDIG